MPFEGRYDLELEQLGPFPPRPARTEKSSKTISKEEGITKKKKTKVVETPPIRYGRGKGLMVNPNTKLVNYLDREEKGMEEYKKKREDEKKRKEEERRRKEGEERREIEETQRDGTEASPAVDLRLTAEVSDLPAGRASEGAIVPIESPSDNIPLSARQSALAEARLGKRARSDDGEGSVCKRANTDAPLRTVAYGSLNPVVDLTASEETGEGQPIDQSLAMYDFDFSFIGEGERLTQFPWRCAELTSSIKGGEEFAVDYVEDLFSEKVYTSWSQHTV